MPSKGGVAMEDYMELIYLIIVLYLLRENSRLLKEIVNERNKKR